MAEKIKSEKPYPYLKKLEESIHIAKHQDAGKKSLKRKINSGPAQIAKKMGEEAVEMVIASGQESDKDFLNEAADVFYYYLLALHDRGFKLRDVLLILKSRNI
ncbi:MAG: phosphoribosyl-ATP diphosphatase [Weeksellaceae bacterium]|nr:phosphoribosyl-ATP diphosphatase [Weeksellaceae bacterium]